MTSFNRCGTQRKASIYLHIHLNFYACDLEVIVWVHALVDAVRAGSMSGWPYDRGGARGLLGRAEFLHGGHRFAPKRVWKVAWVAARRPAERAESRNGTEKVVGWGGIAEHRADGEELESLGVGGSHVIEKLHGMWLWCLTIWSHVTV